jgi:hypothetical protein
MQERISAWHFPASTASVSCSSSVSTDEQLLHTILSIISLAYFGQSPISVISVYAVCWLPFEMALPTSSSTLRLAQPLPRLGLDSSLLLLVLHRHDSTRHILSCAGVRLVANQVRFHAVCFGSNASFTAPGSRLAVPSEL